MEANEDVLVSEEASTILAQTGLINLYQRAAAHESAQVSNVLEVQRTLFYIACYYFFVSDEILTGSP